MSFMRAESCSALVLVCGLALAAPAAGQVRIWTGAVSSLWSNPANWNPQDVPDTTAEIPQFYGGPTCTLDINTTVGAVGTFSVQALIRIAPGRTLNLGFGPQGGNGAMEINDGISTLPTIMNLTGSPTWNMNTSSGPNTIALKAAPGVPTSAQITCASGVRGSLGSTYISGSGRISAPFLLPSSNILLANVPGQALEVINTPINPVTSAVLNAAVMESSGGGILRFFRGPGGAPQFDIEQLGGIIRAGAGSFVEIGSGVTIRNGTVVSSPSGTLTLAGAELRNVRAQPGTGTMTVGNATFADAYDLWVDSGVLRVPVGSSLNIFNALTLDGVVQLGTGGTGTPATLTITPPNATPLSVFSNNQGWIELNATLPNLATARLNAVNAGLFTQTNVGVRGDGTMQGVISIGGDLNPGKPVVPFIGELTQTSGSLTLRTTATFTADIYNGGPGDKVTGNASIFINGGTLRVNYQFATPAADRIYDLLRGTLVAGQFTTHIIPPSGPTGPAHVIYRPDRVSLVMCYANCDGSTSSPTLNVLDYSCFLTRYQAGDAYANCDGSTIVPTLNALDFSCFLSKFNAGCPGVCPGCP